MKHIKQKLASRIICGFLIPVVLILNTGVAKVAYAVEPTPGLDCSTNFQPGFIASVDNQLCTKENYDPNKDSCPPGFARDNPVSETKLVCAKVTSAGASPQEAKTLMSSLAVIGGLQNGLNRLMWPVLVLIGGLMENDLLYGNGMEEKLRDIWIPIRNLVNILFVIVLVGLALYNVLGLSDDNSSIKAMLPKIVIGIIAVNFSFIAIKVVLDGINVLNTAIFALPDQVSQDLGKVGDNMTAEEQARLCANFAGSSYSQYIEQSDDSIKKAVELNIYRNVGMQPDFQTAKVTISDSKEQIVQKIKTLDGGTGGVQKSFDNKVAVSKGGGWCDGKVLSANGRLFLSHYNSRNAAFALALNMGKIIYYQDVDPKLANSTADGVEKVFTNSLFSMLLYIVYAASFIALFIVLMGRLVVMWLSIAVSPILLLMIASPQVKEKMGGLSKLSENFTKNAIAPIIISLALTIGWIMLKAIQGIDISAQTSSFAGGSVLGTNPSNGIPVAGLNTLQDIVVALGVIGVVWVGVFAAAEGTIADFAVNWIKDQVTSAGKFLGALPFKHMPMFPVALPDHPHEHYTATLPEMMHSLNKIKNNMENAGGLSSKLGLDNIQSPDDLKKIHNQEGLLNYIKPLDKDKLANKENRTAFKEWISHTENRKEIDRMKVDRNAEVRRLGEQIELLASGDEAKAKAAAIEIKKLKIAQGDTTVPALDDKKAAATPGAVVAGDKGVGDKLGTDERRKTTNESKTKIDAALTKKGGPDKESVKAQVAVIAKTLADATGAVAKDDDMKAILGPKYAEAVAACEGNGAYVEILKKNGPTPPAPAAGAAPATAPGTPPAVTPPQPGATPPAPTPPAH